MLLESFRLQSTGQKSAERTLTVFASIAHCLSMQRTEFPRGTKRHNLQKHNDVKTTHLLRESGEPRCIRESCSNQKLCAFLDQCRVTQNALCNLAMTMSQIPGSETAPASPEYLKSGQHNKMKNRTKHDFQFPFKELTNQKQDSSVNIK